MICKIRKTIEKFDMFKDNRNITVGLSGGADSCALLYALCQMKDEYSLNIIAAHVNHGIRGEEAERDENFSMDFCKKLGVPIRILHTNVPKKALAAGMGVEECGRKIRYEFFESINPGALIATAHNLNDQCETLLFNITRGASVRGLRSIPAVRGNIIRPLIECTREEIEDFCRENGIEYITDSTNLSDIYTRNKIRLNVIPQLKEINPSFEQAASRLIESANEDEEYFSEIIERTVSDAAFQGGYDAEKLLSCKKAVMKRAVGAIIENETGSVPEAVHIKNVCDILQGGKTQVLFGTQVQVKNGVLTFGEKILTESWERKFILDEEIITPAKAVKFQIVNKNEQITKQFVHKNMLDFDCIVGQLTLRSRKTGDEIRIAGRNCTKKIKKLFTEAKIADKNSVLILSDDIGVVWVEGFGCAERCKISDNTIKILKIVYSKRSN